MKRLAAFLLLLFATALSSQVAHSQFNGCKPGFCQSVIIDNLHPCASPPPFDSLSPTGAWSVSRKLLTAYAGSLYTLASGDVQTVFNQTGSAGRDFDVDAPAGGTRPGLNISNIVAAMDFDGSADWLRNGQLANFITVTDGYMIVSFKSTGFSTNSGTSYLNAALFQDDANFGMTERANAGSPLLYATNWGGGQNVQFSIVANVTHVVEMWHTSGNLVMRLDGNTAGQQTVASGNTSIASDRLNLGGKFLTAGHQGLIWEAAIMDTVPSLADRDALVASFTSCAH